MYYIESDLCDDMSVWWLWLCRFHGENALRCHDLLVACICQRENRSNILWFRSPRASQSNHPWMVDWLACLSKMDADVQHQRVRWDWAWYMGTDFSSRLERAKKMRLYQHAARCPSALRVFLECNPQYWCFIPRPCNETMMNHFNCLGEPLERVSEMDHLVQSGVIDDRRLIRYLEHVPLPPAGFMFSYQDRQQQRFFFKHLLSVHHDQMPYIPLDLYKVSIIAVRKWIFLGWPFFWS